MSQAIGILGGTFDPVHYGHLLLAETCREQLQLDQIRLMPAGDPPHKTGRRIAPGMARADMLEFAVSGYSDYLIDRRELKRSGPSFTVDTLAEFQAEFPEDRFYFLMGADSLRDFPKWRQPERIVELATVVAVNRPGIAPLSDDVVREWLGDLTERVVRLTMPGTDLSATELRERVAAGKSLRFMTPRAVEAYAVEHGLYAQANGQ